MPENVELTDLIGDIYDTALDRELWTDALAGVAKFVGGPIGVLGAEELVCKLIDVDAAGLDLQCTQLHERACGNYDTLATMPPIDAGEVTALPAFMPCDDESRALLQREGARPRSWGNGADTLPDKPEPGCMSVDIVRSEANDMADNDLADHEMRRRVALIAPHLRRAILIGEVIDQKANEAATFAGVLDSMRAGLFLISADGQIVHANAAGRQILAADDVLRSIGGRLAARDPAFNRTLRDMCAGRGDPAIGGSGIALPLTARDGECHVAHIRSLGEGARDRGGMPSEVIAVVFVCKATPEISSSADVIQQTFQLTPTELRVLLAIFNVGGIPQVAAALDVAASTIRTHVSRLYDKTGAARQADLVKLVAGFLNPVVD